MTGFRLALLLSVVWPLAARAAEPEALPSPAGPGAMGAALTNGPDGAVYLSWLEPADADAKRWTLRFSRFEADRRAWTPAREIAGGEGWFVNWADFPQLAVQEKRMTAVWFVENPSAPGHGGHHGAGYHARYAVSTDRGATWSEPAPITRESTSVEFVALLPLGDDHLLAAWLDGRQRGTGQDRQALYSRLLGEFPERPDRLLDDSVCDCCQLALTRLPADRWMIAYRDRTADEIRDIVYSLPTATGMSPPQPLGADHWKIAGCPVNGPRLAARAERLAAIWYTGAGDLPKVQSRVSTDGGRTFTAPNRLDLGKPVGRVDAVVRADGRMFVAWLESSAKDSGNEGGLYLRELRADGSATVARLLAATRTTRAGGFPRLAADASGRLVVAYTRDAEPAQVATLLVAPE